MNSIGCQKGREVLALQQELSSIWTRCSKKEQLRERIVQIFESATSYQELYALRETIDSYTPGTSSLHTLVYNDLDTRRSHQLLRLINKNVQTAYATTPKEIKYSYMVYSDIDDTIKASVNDTSVHISGFYPSALEFYKQLMPADKQVGLTFLSIRPELLRSLWNRHLTQSLPKELTFFSLYGSFSLFVTAIVYYTAISLLAAIAKRLPEWRVKEKISNFCKTQETKLFISFALEKRRQIDRDLLLRPERRAIFVGDCGEGDLIFLLMKNCGVPIPLSDPKIPEEYLGEKKWDSSLCTPGNPTNKPLYLSLAHALSSVKDYGVRPDPKYREEYDSQLHTHVFDNYVDTATICLKKGILNRDSCDKVVAVARKWLADQKIEPLAEEESLDQLPPDIKYRQKLFRSIRSYDVYEN